MIHYSGQGPVMGSCAESNEHACYIRRREFLDQLISYFAEHQWVDTSTAKEISGKSLTSVKRYLRKLVAINIIEANGANKNRVYRLIKK